jgi:hypothetical protein
MTATQLSELRRPRVLLNSGAVLDLSQPDPWGWTDQDMAERLSRTARWAGASKWARPMSVAQHSILVLRIREQAADEIDCDHARYELLHDSEEGFLGFDPITPLKSRLGPEFHDLCAELKAAISTRYQLPTVSDQTHDAHKAADRCAAASEALHVAGWSEDQIRNVLQIEAPILKKDPVFDLTVSKAGYEPWEPWEPSFAARQFLQMLRALECGPHSRGDKQ